MTGLELWQIRGAEDLLCTQYDQTLWAVGKGPQPIKDTHPNCRCVRIPFSDLVDGTDFDFKRLTTYTKYVGTRTWLKRHRHPTT